MMELGKSDPAVGITMDSPEMCWGTFGTAPESQKSREWMLRAGLDTEGRVYLMAALDTDGDESQALERVTKDNAPAVLYRDHVYVDIQWLFQQRPSEEHPKLVTILAAAMENLGERFPDHPAVRRWKEAEQNLFPSGEQHMEGVEDLEWVLIDQPPEKSEQRPDWARLVCRDPDGRIYVSAGIGNDEATIMRQATEDGIVMAYNGKHGYVPLDWFGQRLPHIKPVLNYLRIHAQRLFDEHYPKSAIRYGVDKEDERKALAEAKMGWIRWFVFPENPIAPEIPEWMRMAADDRDGRIWAPAVLVDPAAVLDHNEDRMAEKVRADGIPSLWHQEHLYVPLDWLIEKWPEAEGPRWLFNAMRTVIAHMGGPSRDAVPTPISNRLH